MKTKTKGLIALIVVFVAAIYYYVTIPAINIHSTDTVSYTHLTLPTILLV